MTNNGRAASTMSGSRVLWKMAVYTRQPKNRGCMPNEGSDDCWTMDYQTACKENIGPDQLPPVQKSYKNV